MATDPSFASTVNNGSALLGTAETNLQVPVNASVLITAGASGTQINEIMVVAASTGITPTTVAGLVYVYVYDGATYRIVDVVNVRAVTASATVAPYRAAASDFASGSGKYTNLTLKTGWSLRASQSIAGNASLLVFTGLGADF